MFGSLFGNRNVNKVIVNGKTYTCNGSSIVIKDGKIMVDNQMINDEPVCAVTVIVNGNPDTVECSCGSVTVNGNANIIRCAGSCDVAGDVAGTISAGGSVRCGGNAGGNIMAGGSVTVKR